MAIQKINEGITGEQAANILYENDKEANEVRDHEVGGTYYTNEKAVGADGILYRVRPTVPSTTTAPPSADWQSLGFSADALNPYLDAGELAPNYVDVTADVEYLDNSVMLKANNGAITANPDATLYKVPVVKGQAVKFIGRVGSNSSNNAFAVLWQFDASDVYVDLLATTDVPATADAEVTAAATADGFIYVNTRKVPGATPQIFRSVSVMAEILTTESETVAVAQYAKDKVDDILNDSLGGQTEITGSPDILQIDNSVIQFDTGAITANANALLFKIPVITGDVIRITAGIGGASNASGFIALYQYDASDAPVGTLARTYTPGAMESDISAAAISDGFIYANTRKGTGIPVRLYKGVNEFFIRNTTLGGTPEIISANDRIDELEAEMGSLPFEKIKMTPYLRLNSFTEGWAVNGGAALGDTLTIDAAGGVAALSKRYISDVRAASYRISAAGGTIRIGALQNLALTSLLYSTCAELNIGAGTLTIYRGGGSNGIAGLTPITSKALEVDLSEGEIIMEIKREREVTTLTVRNAYTMAADSLSFDGGAVLFAQGAGNHRPHYFISSTQSLTLSSFTVAGAYGIQVAHVGDSISEANGRADASSVKGKNWVERVIDYLGGDLINVSQSGMTPANGLEALANEVAFMKPKQVSVSLGTNGGITVAQIQAFIDFMNENGLPYVINHVPMTHNRQPDAVSSAQVVNGNIDTFGVQSALMDYATAIGGNVANGADLTCFNSDGLHPNQLGNDRMFQRFLTDILQIHWPTKK